MNPTSSVPPRSLRLWPGVLVVALQWALRFAVPELVPAEHAPMAAMIGAMGALLGGLLFVVWWAFFSRAPRVERLGGSALMMLALAGTSRVVDESIATGGMGILFYVYAFPVLCLAFLAWAIASRGMAGKARAVSMIAAVVLACAGWTLVRTGGITGTGESDFAWRWAPTPEEQLLASSSEPAAVDLPAGEAAAALEIRWPGFRGAARNSVVVGTRLATDWAASPPVELWRRPVGPAWSSFAVAGERLFTQEQRGEHEVVACYDATSGEPVWMHRDATRFWESNAGAGPRGTPTLHETMLYSLGATGVVNALDARTGSVLWTRDAAADTGAGVPEWGFSSSPLIVDDLVIVAATGALVAYDRTSGETRWTAQAEPASPGTYSSPHLLTLGETRQVLQSSDAGVAAFAPSDGALLWKHEWSGSPIVQPALTDDGALLVSVSQNGGLRRLSVSPGEDGAWNVETRWTTIRLKPFFNDFVLHDGHAFGFDSSMLACVDLERGKRQWKGGRYGFGQMLLLADQDLLLVLSEEGELALVAATTDDFHELARHPVLAGKTWNHPVLVDDVVFVCNSEEMAAFRLPTLSDQG